MSFDLRNLREISNEPQSKFINQLAKKLAKFLNANQVEKLENKEDLYSVGQDVDSVIKVHSLNSTKSFDSTTLYYPTFEPDYNKLVLWIKGANMGNTIPDVSGFDQVVNLYGDALLMDGTPFDSGIHTAGTKSLALRFNRPTSETENQEYISIDDNDKLGIEGISSAMSYFIRFRVESIEEESDQDRRIFEKVDDSGPNEAISLRVSENGRLILHIVDGGTEYSKQTATDTIAIDIVYDVWITYTVAGNVIHIYVNGVDKTLTTPGGPTWHDDLTDNNLNIFRRGAGSEDGYTYGDLYDFRIYRNDTISAAEVGYMYANKWTIEDIPFGQVAIANYSATNEPITTVSSFTTTSFTTTSFDT